VVAAVAIAGAAAAIASPAAARTGAPSILANRCFALRSVTRAAFVTATGGDRYRVSRKRKSKGGRFYLKPTGLGTYMLRDRGGKLMTVAGASAVTRTGTAGPSAEWRPARITRRYFTIASTANGRALVAQRKGDLALAPPGSAGRAGRFSFVGARHCKRFPEAGVDTRGRPFRGKRTGGRLLGFADMHLHITADLRAGGEVIYGQNFNRFGVAEALGHDDQAHGPDGGLDVTGNLLRGGNPAGTHDTHGWPTFAGWPVHDTYTHQQTYWVWLKRAWEAGERLVVAQTVEDEPLCKIEPRRTHSCDETATVELQIARLRALERYVDAQSGGAGRGWFRLVYSPAQARRAIKRGKLAVLIGMEASDPFGCSEVLGVPQCTRADIDRRLDELYRRGLRSMFVAHWIDNAFAGAAFEGGATGQFISAMQVEETGQPFSSQPCTGADEADGQCNTKGLTDLGRYVIGRLMAKHMLIETDHMSQKARESVLELASASHYPLVSSHTGTGGAWTPSQLKRLYAIGGLASARPDTATKLAGTVFRLRGAVSDRAQFACGLGTDTGGFNALPGARGDARAHPLRYPFKSYDRKVRFSRQRSGTRVYDLNLEGVAHYGLFADLLADVQRQTATRPALRPLFHSADAYVRMWQRAVAHH